ncbi:MAG: threonine synthase [Acuticoccus sp.]
MVCTACAHVTPLAAVASVCPSCGGILDWVPGERPPQVPGAGVWRHADLLPTCAPEHRVSLGEGGAPLLAAPRLGDALGLSDLWVKNESLQPSGSFKDVGVAVAVSLAKAHGRPGAVLSSSGNAGASAAAYCARAGLPLVVLVPATAPPAKLRQIAITGARLVTVDGPTADCCRLAGELAAARGWVNLTTTFHNPYGIDGYATFAAEIADLAPEILLLPISSGPLLAGMMKGFERLAAAGRVATIPRPVAVQPVACAPITRAYGAGGAVTPWTFQPTVAGALNDTLAGYERDGDRTLHFIRRHGGAAVAVDDPAIIAAQHLAARTEGLVLEPSAAVPFAAIDAVRAALDLTGRERILAVVTGHGLKDLSTVDASDLPSPIAPRMDTLLATLDASAG